MKLGLTLGTEGLLAVSGTVSMFVFSSAVLTYQCSAILEQMIQPAAVTGKRLLLPGTGTAIAWTFVFLTLSWNCFNESQTLAQMKGVVMTMDAASLESSTELSPSQIFFIIRDACDIVQFELGPKASSSHSLKRWR